MTQTLLVIDGHHLCYRAFYGFPSSLTLDGHPINAVYGFISMMLSALETLSPDYFCITFDRKEPTFRHVFYDGYKATRKPPPDDFKSQLPILDELLKRLSFPTLSLAGYEADDLMGTLAHHAEKKDIHTYLMTGDMDALQLVTTKTSVLSPQRGSTKLREYTPEKVKEKYNVTPEQVIYLKALMGDSSDNIPGVPGIGEKTAQLLLQQFQNIDDIYERLSEVSKDSVRKKLASSQPLAEMSLALATIKIDVPIDIMFTNFVYKPHWETILPILKEFNFDSLVRRYQQNLSLQEPTDIATTMSSTLTPPEGTYQCIKTISALKKLLPELKKGFAIDLETTSLNANDAEIVGISLSFKEKEAVYIPCNAYLEKSPESADTVQLFQPDTKHTPLKRKLSPYLTCLKPLLENKTIPKYTHHGKYEWLIFKAYGITLQGIAFDSLLAAYLLFPGESIGLKALAKRLYTIDMTPYEELTGSGKNKHSFADVPIEKATAYAAADADITLRLKKDLAALLKETELSTLFHDIELPLQDVLADMEHTGVTIDMPYLRDLEDMFSQECHALSKRIFELAGTSFNLNSPKQLSDILFTTLSLPIVKKTKTGFSTDASVLEKLKEAHPIIPLLQKYRTLEKLNNTYVSKLPHLVHPKTDRIHTSFNQTITITGRLSSTKPNLQNIPIRTEEGQKIRRAFIPSVKKNIILSADYSQIELRLIAHLAQDETMCRAFQQQEDIHKSTASVIFDCPIDDVSSDLRYRAKAVNFGIIYGISPYGLSQNLKIHPKEAKEIIDAYFEKFSTIKTFTDETIRFAEKHGFVQTLYGRRRPIPEILSDIAQRRQFAQRTAVNSVTQGTAADIIKIAMIQIHHKLDALALNSKMIIQVHDELVFDVPEDEKEQMISLVRTEMEGAASLSIPLTVDIVTGKNWQDIS